MNRIDFILKILRSISIVLIGKIMVKIVDYQNKFELEKKTGNDIVSDSHIINNYKVRLSIYLNGTGKGKGTHMSLFLDLMPGEYDDAIQWPFDKSITFSVIHQDDKDKSYKKQLILQNNDKALQTMKKPVTDGGSNREYSEFLSLQKLHDEGFVKEDTLYVFCEID